MDAADLDRRARTHSGWIPPLVVSRLLELGYEEVVELRAGRGEWFCALEWARLLGDRGRQEEALEVLAPYVATDWWTAVRARVELLERWGRVEEAIALARPYARGGGFKLELLARLLARYGRQDEAVTRLTAGIEDPCLAHALVELWEGAGRDEDIAVLLAARTPAPGHRCEDPWCCPGLDPDTAIGLLAAVRERQGRVDEAIALLRTRQITSVNDRDELAELLARQDRIEELRAYAASEPNGLAAQRLAELLEERGDVDGAIAVYRLPDDSPVCRVHVAWELAGLLARHGRGDEAIEVMRALADSAGGADEWIVGALCTLYADHGRALDGLAYLDTLTTARGGREEWEFFRPRLRLMAAGGLLDEAIGLARERPEGDSGYAAWTISDLLAETGRTEEAVAVLEPHGADHPTLLAGHLIGLGRIEEAVALFPQRAGQPFVPVWSGTFTAEPPL
ncbi:hypothetical protein ABZZ17_19890 [Streptomyces sp. NPDC006512]|uniref:tetratricopeptide repeat protein n=1 Tax=Streptomyces sp. NPDC006512 TaxID=3154307 RepID=UPI0033B697BC